MQLSSLLLLLSTSPSKHTSMPSPAILWNLVEKKWTKNHPQYLSGLSRALFPTTFFETAVCIQPDKASKRTKLSVAIAKYGGSGLVSGWNNIQLDHFNLGSWGVLYVKLFVFSILAIGIWHFYAIIMFWMVLAVRSIDVEWMLCRYFSSWQFCMAFSC